MRVLAFLVSLLAFTSSASAFHEIESFSRSTEGGGNGVFFTGSSRFKGYDCRICHTNTEDRISIQLEVNRPELLQGQYETNTGYAITVKMIGEHRGLDSAFNPNTFMLEFVTDQGESVGDYLPGPAPAELIDEGRILAAEGFGEGETEWNFTWFTPRESAGPLTLHIAMLDGDGAGEKELRWIDPLHDDVATMSLRLCPAGQACPKPDESGEVKSAVHCSMAGGNPSAVSALAWLFIAFVWFGARRARLCLLAGSLLFFSCSPDKRPAPEPTTKAAPAWGFRLTYGLDPSTKLEAPAKEAALERALSVVRNRLEATELASSVRREGEQIIVELADSDEASHSLVRHLVPHYVSLEFRLVRSGSDFMKNLCESVVSDSKAGVMKIETGLDVWQGADGSTVKECYLSAADRMAMLNSQEAEVEGCRARGDRERTECVVSGRRILERYLGELKLEVGDEILFELRESSSMAGGERFWRSYYLAPGALLRGDMIETVKVQENEQTLGEQLLIEFSEEGAARLEELTRQNVGRKLAIVIDGKIESAPVIRDAILGGTIVLDLGPDSSGAETLASALRSGALLAPLIEVSAKAL